MHQPDRLISGSRIKACVFVKFGLSWSFVVFKSAPGYASRYVAQIISSKIIINMSNILNGGVVIIGSLLWDNNNRQKWRDSSLIMEKKIQVALPIRYGRESGSRSNTYTMVFSNKCYSYGLGSGWVAPIKTQIKSFEDIKKEAELLAMAEGINSGLVSDWGIVGILFRNRRMIDKEILEKWSMLVNIDLSTHQIYKQKLISEQPVIDSNGFLKINWPRSVDGKTNLNAFDFLLGTVTVPTLKSNRYPSAFQIAKSMINNNYFEYFKRNIECDIRTFQDERIKNSLNKFNQRKTD